MLKNSILFLILFVASGFSACAQKLEESCNKYSEPSLGISFCAPPKWTIIKKPNQPYQQVNGEDKNGKRSNINVVASDYEGDLTALAVMMTNELTTNYAKENGYSYIKFEGKSEFSAKTAKGYKSVYSTETDGLKIRTIQYLFSGRGNTKIVITATSLAAEKDSLDKVFDDAMKTFEVGQ